jgi:hypothetical protein
VSRPKPPAVTLPAQRHQRPYLIHWERTLRWQDRAAESIASGGGWDAFDYLFALFASIFHMRDWIIASRQDLESEVSALFSTSPDLALVRDIANGVKHMETSRYRVDGTASVAREYAGNGKYQFVIPRPGGRNLDCLVLADRCIEEVGRFMAAHDLLPSGSS